MPQIINEPGIGGNLGAAFGTGLGGALQFLAQNKLQNMMQQQQQARTLPALQALGYTPEEASSLSGLNPSILQEVVKQKLQQPSQQAYAQALSSLLGGGESLGYEPETPAEYAAASTQQPTPEQESYIRSLSNLFGTPQPQPSKPALIQEKVVETPQKTVETKKVAATIPAGLTQQQSNQLAQLALQKKREERESEKFNLEKQKLAQAETKQYFNEVTKKGKVAREFEPRLKLMLEKIKSGNLPNATLWNFLTKLEDESATPLATAGGLAGGTLGAILGSPIPVAGIPAGATAGGAIGAAIGTGIGALVSPLAGMAKSVIRAGSPDIEEFEKLSADFIKFAKDFFPSRITDADLKAYLATIPTLMQTDAGKKRIINNILQLNKIAELEDKAAREIVKKNKGLRPIDLEQQVKDKIEPEINKFILDFTKTARI